VIAAACSGDLISQQILAEAGAHLGTAIAGLVNLFNPSMIVIGGGVSQIGDLLLEPIRRTVQKRSLKMASRRLRISTAFWDDAHQEWELLFRRYHWFCIKKLRTVTKGGD
jgi:predicted NBD/HSP70 family sugar kinase